MLHPLVFSLCRSLHTLAKKLLRIITLPGQVEDEPAGLGAVEVDVGGEVAELVEVVELDVRRAEHERDGAVEYVASDLLDTSDTVAAYWHHFGCRSQSPYLVDVLHVDVVFHPVGGRAEPAALEEGTN